MGTGNSIRREVGTNQGAKIPVDVIIKLRNNICKITYVINNIEYHGTGFFMMINNSLKSLITANHVISKNMINKNITLQLYNKKNLQLKLNDR